MANGNVHWAALETSWAATCGREEPSRTASALKTAYAKFRIPSLREGTRQEVEINVEAHNGKGYWAQSELDKLERITQRYKALGNGRINWSDLHTEWESSRPASHPQRTIEALKCAHARISKQRSSQISGHTASQTLDLERPLIEEQEEPPGESSAVVDPRSPAECSDDRGASVAQSISEESEASTTQTGSQNSENEGDESRRRRRKGTSWETPEVDRLRNLVETHRDTSGSINWDALKHAWEQTRQPNEPMRTTNALKSAYAKLTRPMQRRRGISDNEQDEPSLADRHNDQRGNEPVETETTSEAQLYTNMKERFNRVYQIAIRSHDRQPIKRPTGEIPSNLLLLGNQILREKLNSRNSTNKRTLTALNAAVYAIAKVISMLASEEEAEKAGKIHQNLREYKEIRNYLLKLISFTLTRTQEKNREQRSPQQAISGNCQIEESVLDHRSPETLVKI
ncbi:hypothetical protein OSTOST_12833 [Ostertagia ostertagi]